MLYFVIFLILSTVIAVLFIIEIKCVVEYLRNDIDDNIVISFYILEGIFKYKYEIPLIDLGQKGIKFRLVKEIGKKDKVIGQKKEKLDANHIYEKFLTIRDYYINNREIICDLKDYIKNKIVLAEFNIKISSGTGNACNTGIICGFLWMAAGLLFTFLSNTFSGFKKSINIIPNYYHKETTVDIFCIFHIKLVHIIVMITKIYFNQNRASKIEKGRQVVN